MAFTKKTWKDRLTEYPTRRRLTKSDGTSELVTVSREEGTVSQAGDAFSAANMNDLENRVAAAFAGVSVGTDTTLTKSGEPADAKAVGDAIGEINMKYDPTTDMTYLKGEDGIWYEWKMGGLQIQYLIRDGYINELLTGGYEVLAGNKVNPVVTKEDGYLNIRIDTGRVDYWQGGVFVFPKAIDVTNYSKIYFECSASANTNISHSEDGWNGTYFKISTAKPTSWINVPCLASKQIVKSGQTSYNGTDFIDVSGMSGVVYIWILQRFEFYPNIAWTEVNISNMWFE